MFRESDHEYSGSKFHEYCDNKEGTITIIKSNLGNIFEGYTSKSWKATGLYTRYENAFLFLIKSDDRATESKCPLLLELKKDHANCAIYCDSSCSPTCVYQG